MPFTKRENWTLLTPLTLSERVRTLKNLHSFSFNKKPVLKAAVFLCFSYNWNVLIAVGLTFFEPILNRWVFHCSLLTGFPICLFLSLSHFILSLPVSRIAEVLYSSLPPTPTTTFPFNIFKQQEGAQVPSKEQSPLGVLYESSGGRVAPPGSDSTFCHPPNLVQSHPVCPCFSSSSNFFFKTLYNEVQFLLMEGCFMAQSDLLFFFYQEKIEAWDTPPTNFILKLLMYYEWGKAVVFFTLSLPDSVFENAFKRKPW